MATKTLTTQHPVLTSNRTALPPAIQRKLLELEVESTYNRPDLCLVTFDLDANTEIPPALELGKPFEIGFRGESAVTKIFEGEITALEFDSHDNRSVFIVQAEDKFHRFFRGDNVRTWLKKSVSEAVQSLCTGATMHAGAVESTSSKPDFLMQQNVTDGAWLIERAGEYGFHVRAKEGKLFWGKVGAGGDSGVTLEQKRHLLGFSCRVTANAFIAEAAVHSWNMLENKAIEQTATTYAGLIDDKVAPAFNPAKISLARSDLGSVDEAIASAQAAVDRANEHNLQAEGQCYGDAKLAVDKTVTIKGVNKRFDGKFRISHLRHRFSAEQGFTTHFSCRGVSDQTLAGLVAESAASPALVSDRSVFDGVTVGVVTDTNDPSDLGRVKVQLPSLTTKQTTDWLRVAFAGGGGGQGSHHGWYLLPEKGDEVLVAFEQGDARRGYVLGGLLNGVHKPNEAYKKDSDLENGKVNKHAFRLKTGGHLLFDETASKEVIEIKNKDGCFTFKYSEEAGVEIKHSAKGEKFAIDNKGDVTITSTDKNITINAAMGALTLKAQKDITIESQTGKVAIKAAAGDVTVDGVNVKATGQMNAEVKGNVQGKLEGGATAVVKGGMVMIN